jgi:hypothetical protein
MTSILMSSYSEGTGLQPSDVILLILFIGEEAG